MKQLTDEQYKEMIRLFLVLMEDWWPLVHDKTCRQVVRKQGQEVRDFLDSLKGVKDASE